MDPEVENPEEAEERDCVFLDDKPLDIITGIRIFLMRREAQSDKLETLT